jgi:hypothetical protein
MHTYSTQTGIFYYVQLYTASRAPSRHQKEVGMPTILLMSLEYSVRLVRGVPHLAKSRLGVGLSLPRLHTV